MSYLAVGADKPPVTVAASTPSAARTAERSQQLIQGSAIVREHAPGGGIASVAQVMPDGSLVDTQTGQVIGRVPGAGAPGRSRLTLLLFAAGAAAAVVLLTRKKG